MAAASDAETGNQPGKVKYDRALCDAHLYAGLWRIVHDDQAGAAPLLKTAVDKCAGSIAEDIAQAELAKMAPGDKAK